MQFFTPETTVKKSKYFPRHFHALATHFCDLEWPDSLDSAEPGNWVMAVRSPGYHGLGRKTAEKMGIQCAFDVLSAEEMQLVMSRGGKLLIDLGWEILNPTAEVVSSLSRTLDQIGIDPTRVFIFHSNQSARQEFNRLWMKIAGTQGPYSLEYPVAVALCVIHQEKHRDDGAANDRMLAARRRTEEAARSRLFVSFNGEVRPHRLYVAAALEQLGILDRGYLSLVYPRKSAKETDVQFRERSLRTLRKLPRGADFVDAAQRILDRLPMELDIAAIPPGGIESIAWVSQDPSFYDDSRFTVVVDTAMSESNCLFVTEKVLKPIMNHSPFLLVGSPGGANLLRSFGFKTFEPHIKQCEAGTMNDMLSHAVAEIERLSRLSEAELDALSRRVADICDYNARHFREVFPSLLRHKFEECLQTLGPPLEAG